MATYIINASILKKLCAINQFSIPDVDLVFFGIRGSLPMHTEDYSFQNEVQLNLIDVDYTHMRCTLLQWQKSTDKIASFPGSTVPYIDSIKKAQAANGVGTNCLIPSYFNDFIKGIHYGSHAGNACEAFVQSASRAYRRSADNFSYDNDDRVEVGKPFDDLHAAWTDSLDGKYSSEGCQVVLGVPKCEKLGPNSKNTAAWGVFQNNAYAIAQTKFPYVLLTGREIISVASKPVTTQWPAKLRFGSSGQLVINLQNLLKAKGMFNGSSTGNFDGDTLVAVLKWQKTNFGNQSADGIVGPNTAATLGLALPLV